MNDKFYLKCIDCGKEYGPSEVVYTCNSCQSLLTVEYSKIPGPLDEKWKKRPLSVWRYRELLPIFDRSVIVTLGEGGTKLHLCQNLARILGMKRVYVKNEGENPTGSFKDRGITVGVTKAVELGMGVVICASTGNTSASLAAYAAKAGLRCIVLIPSGSVAFGKLAQAVIHGAEIIRIRGNFDDTLRIVQRLCANYPLYLLNSINPYRLEGQKTIAFEIWDQLNRGVPDSVVVPVGNAGNISAIWKGFVELHELGLIKSLPRMVGVQAEGASPIVDAFKMGREKIEPLLKPETIATAIRIGSPANWKKALRAIKESGGTLEKVSDTDILEAQGVLARHEGLFVEPASAASIAGLRKLVDSGSIKRDEEVVCIATGHGLKDPEAVLRRGIKPIEVEANFDAVRRLVRLGR